ncbi:MAG: PD40 domain-containing protein [Chloroflexi bacterium]|nr:PD40 domain-containing protein [Chloroflexota bacterium]
MRLRKIILLIVVSLPALLLLTPALAQGPDGQPRRLTFDGHSTPIGWEADGLRVMRPGALLDEAGRQRIASQLWRIAPADGRAELIAADSPPAERELTSRSATRAVTVIAAMSTAPELWVSLADGSQPRRLLTSDSEYFGPPLFAPDGSRFVFTRTPRGSETHGLSAIWAADADGQNILSLVAEASAPVWSPDGAQIAFEHQGDVYVASARTPITGWPRVEKPAPLIPAPLALTEPATIRVSHDINNTCRPGVPAGQIDTYAFETYLTYVVQTEISASDPTEQLKVQAVASRTYAWNEILGSGGSSYDVTDWTLSQAMCPNKVDARSTAAVTATVGQYVAYGGALIDTLYSAENGDPTLSNWFSSCCQQYLAAVDDPVSFGYTRSGHGIGMSQNGANRWALTYGWDYIQILTNYYSSVTIEGPTNFGAFNAPWNNRYLNANRARIVAATSNNSRLSVYARGSGLTNTLVTTNALVSALDLTNLPDQPLGSLFITATLSNTQVATLTLGLDRAPPTGTLSVPHLTTSLTVTAQLSGTDSGSGFAGYGMSNNWIWEGEKQYSLTVGTVVSDAAALNGQAMYAPASGNGGVVYSPYAAAPYGPYTFGLPVGPPYRAYFRLNAGWHQAHLWHRLPRGQRLPRILRGLHLSLRHGHRSGVPPVAVRQRRPVARPGDGRPLSGHQPADDHLGAVRAADHRHGRRQVCRQRGEYLRRRRAVAAALYHAVADGDAGADDHRARYGVRP